MGLQCLFWKVNKIDGTEKTFPVGCSKINKIVYEVFEIKDNPPVGKLLKGKQTDGKRGLATEGTKNYS